MYLTILLKIWGRYQFKDSLVGGTVEVNTDGGKTWVDVLAGGGNFVAGGYNARISPSYASGIAGQPGWSGGDGFGAVSPVDISIGVDAGLARRGGVHLCCGAFPPRARPRVGRSNVDLQF